MFRKILIANRGAIACRILRTVKAMGLEAVAAYSDIDENAPHQAGRDPQKVCAVLPPEVPGIRQPEKRLIHQRRGLQCVSSPLAAHVPASQAA